MVNPAKPAGETRRVFCRGSASLVQCGPMIRREEREEVWTDAYNAALTGLLAAKADGMERYTANNVSVVTDQCKALADQALKDADGFKG
jgi:hypothetical protein